ncbi:hypothetical protein VTO73DRAFT_4610 [Trametes versicolor]
MGLSSFPIEVLEKIIWWLGEDKTALANCSLVCHGLLSLCRVYIWNFVYISYEFKNVPPPRLKALLTIIDNNPTIGLHIRSMLVDGAIHHGLGDDNMAESQHLYETIAGQLFSRLPMLEVLKLRHLVALDICDVAAVAGAIPTLKTLILEDVKVKQKGSGQTTQRLPEDLCAATGTETSVLESHHPWKLENLSIVNGGGIPDSEYTALATFLERFTSIISLKSFEIRDTLVSRWAKASGRGLVVPEAFGSSLHHFGFPIADMDRDGSVHPEGRRHLERLYAALPRCPALRSLSIQYDALGVQGAPTPTGWGPPPVFPFFLDALADILSMPSSSIDSTDTVPLPHLERLSISLFARVDRVLNCADAFAHLASALVGPDGSRSAARSTRASRRYPAFSEITVRVMFAVPRPAVKDESGIVYDAERARYEQNTDPMVLLQPMLESFLYDGRLPKGGDPVYVHYFLMVFETWVAVSIMTCTQRPLRSAPCPCSDLSRGNAAVKVVGKQQLIMTI